jgi:hypothetical protein
VTGLEERLTPELRLVLDYMKTRPCEYVSVRDVRLALGLTNGAARYRLWRLTELGYIVTHLTYVVRPRIRRRWFHYIPPLPKPLVAVVDSKTGFLIEYLEKPYRESSCWLYDEEKREFVEPVTAIKIEKTFSVDTEGHESLLAEVTAWTIIACEDLPNVKSITEEVRRKAIKWFIDKFTNYTREGTAVIPNFKISEDFDIQRRAEGAKYEMQIIEWYLTVTGEWTEKPRILKEGFGAYTTDETPTYPTVEVYVEYSHEEEPHPAHRLPPTGEETA